MRISDWSSDVCSSDLLLGTCRGRRGLTIKGSFSTFQLVGKQPLFPGPTLGALLRIGCRFLAAPAVALASCWLPTCAPCERELAQINLILSFRSIVEEGRVAQTLGKLSVRSAEHTSELQSLMRLSYDGFS